MSPGDSVVLPLAKVRIGGRSLCIKSDHTVDRVACSSPGSAGGGLEDLLHLFLLASFDSSEVIIVSPWISSFELSRKLVYYPYVSSRAIDEILRALGESEIGGGARRSVRVGTRCFDFIDYQLLALAYEIAESGTRSRRSLVEYVRESIEGLRDRVAALLKFGQMTGVEFRFDLGQRLHSKVYVNDFMVLLGSANFTHSGVHRNYECLYAIFKEKEEVYWKLKDYAEALLKSMETYYSCERSVLSSVSSSVGLKLSSLRELVALLDYIVRRISTLAS